MTGGQVELAWQRPGLWRKVGTAWQSSAQNQIGSPNKVLLSAPKAAVRSFAQVMSAELAGRIIRVDCVIPSTIETPIHRELGKTVAHFRSYVDWTGTQVPVGRMGKPEGFAGAEL